MPNHDIGVGVDDLRLGAKDGLRRAAEMSFRIVELGAVAGEITPAGLSASGRRHLVKYADTLGVTIAALGGDLPGLRLTDPRTVDERVTRTCELLQLAADLGVRVVVAGAGATSHPETGEPSPLAIEALRRIGEFADSRGVAYALRPSHEKAESTAGVLATLRCPSLRICVDPALAVMTGISPLALVERLAPDIVLVEARDGTVGSTDRSGCETRFGDGEVDFVGLLAALRDANYAGPLVLRRTDSRHPAEELEDGRDRLRRLLRGG